MAQSQPASQPLDVAVVGSGIAGLAAAWLLSRAHRVTLYERSARAGGHSNTVDVDAPEGPLAIDTGFIVYNTACYPNLSALFEHLAVATAPTTMSFAVSLRDGAYEYKGSALGLHGQPASLFSARHWRMAADIVRFMREAELDLASGRIGAMSLGDYLRHKRYGSGFVEDHIGPMGAAIWSTPDADVLAFPATSFIRFFANHGLLRIANRPQWRTVKGGAREYVRRMLAALGSNVRLGEGVRSITRKPDAVLVETAREQRRFDAAVMAAHADDTLAMLADADGDERRILSAIRYTGNEAVLHTDASLMPRRRRLWASWNYMSGGSDTAASRTGVDELDRAYVHEVHAVRTAPLSVSYWMNSLQPLATATDYFVTLNPCRRIAPERVLARFDYQHPMYDAAAIAAQADLRRIQGQRRTWFAGAWCGMGFHEDGLQAGLWASEAIGGVRRPWTVASESGRLPWVCEAPAECLLEAAP